MLPPRTHPLSLPGGQLWNEQPLQRLHPLGHRAGAEGLKLAPEEPQAEVPAACPVLLHAPAQWTDRRFTAVNWPPVTVFHPGACSSQSLTPTVMWTHLPRSPDTRAGCTVDLGTLREQAAERQTWRMLWCRGGGERLGFNVDAPVRVTVCDGCVFPHGSAVPPESSSQQSALQLPTRCCSGDWP